MSGHSKWANIKHKKASIDAKRGKLFSKLVKEVTLAVKEGGADTSMNMRLKIALTKAKEANVPSKNLDNAIKRGTGEIKGGDIVEVTYEGYGPKGVAIIVECLTDNKNRTFSEVRTTFSKHGGSIGESGSVAWQFEKKGTIVVEKKNITDEEEFIEKILEFGAEDYFSVEDLYIIYTPANDLHKVVESFKKEKIELLDNEVNYVSKNSIELSEEEIEKVRNLIEKIDEIDDVHLIASNEKLKE